MNHKELVNELRKMTGAGVKQCSEALKASSGDLDKANKILRESGAAKAEKKQARITAEGISIALSAGKEAVIVELNCETDFVAKDELFVKFANTFAKAVLEHKPADLEQAKGIKTEEGITFEERRVELVAKIGENISFRRIKFLTTEHQFAVYNHLNKISCIVEGKGDSFSDVAKGIAMHISAMNPEYLSVADVPANVIEEEREVALKSMADDMQGKPENIVKNIIDGKLRKFAEGISLLSQSFVIDPSQSVEQALKSKGSELISYIRFEVGEGIEKKQDNFAEEVYSQISGTR